MIDYIIYLLTTRKCIICKQRFKSKVHGKKTCSDWCRDVNIRLRRKRWEKRNKKKLNSPEYKRKRKEYQKEYHKNYKRINL